MNEGELLTSRKLPWDVSFVSGDRLNCASIFRGTADSDPVDGLRQLFRRGQLSPEDLRRAFIRALLVDAFGDNLSGSVKFQAMTDQVYGIGSGNEGGRNLVDRALVEIGLEH